MSRDLLYQNFSLSDINVVRLLLEFRDKYDIYSNVTDISTPIGAQGALPLSQEVISLYSDLDVLIEKCKFDERQMNIIQMYGNGYTVDEISNKSGTLPSEVRSRFDTICKKIVKENLKQWRKSTYTSVLGLRTKCCGKCKEQLPATNEFFAGNDRSPDGYRSVCRSCR